MTNTRRKDKQNDGSKKAALGEKMGLVQEAAPQGCGRAEDKGNCGVSAGCSSGAGTEGSSGAGTRSEAF